MIKEHAITKPQWVVNLKLWYVTS